MGFMQQYKSSTASFLIVAGGILLFATGLGRVHLFDWDEINFAESAREMLITGDYLNVQVNFETFWEKPPFFIWLQALSMKIFGVNEFAARFPNAIAGVLTLLALFFIGKRLKSQTFGLIWVMLYTCSFLPFFYFKSGIIDPWFNLFIFSGIYFFIEYTAPQNRGNRYGQVILAALFLGLATLTKGPVGFLIFALCFSVYLITQKFRLQGFRWMHLPVFLAFFALVGGLWFLLQIATGNLNIIQDFIAYQIRLFQTKDAGHGGFFLYHFVILFFGVFPASVFALPTFRRNILRQEENPALGHFFRWMMITLWVVLILFTVVQTKIVHYSSMCYFPITFLGAWHLARWMENKTKIGRLSTVLLVAVGISLGMAVAIISSIDSFKNVLIPYINDPFAAGNLEATGNWSGFEWIIGIILMATVMGFAIKPNENRMPRFLRLVAGCLVFIYSGVFFITPPIERYSQNAAIEFYQSKRESDCYIYPLFKSYAHYFYSNRQPQNNNAEKVFLQQGRIDKPVYFVIRNHWNNEANFLQETLNAEKLYERNGFIFYVRYPNR